MLRKGPFWVKRLNSGVELVDDGGDDSLDKRCKVAAHLYWTYCVFW
jgi:hypothetical protein